MFAMRTGRWSQYSGARDVILDLTVTVLDRLVYELPWKFLVKPIEFIESVHGRMPGVLPQHFRASEFF